MGAIARLLGLQEPCPGWTHVWWGTVNCELPARHRGDHQHGKRRWPYG
ncbi:MAG TPA: hypothetical protein VK611_25045 [Acidimicrobiales bacterium]|nr:hypothetical protein [Acidimicrobiales bacterium]